MATKITVKAGSGGAIVSNAAGSETVPANATLVYTVPDGDSYSVADLVQPVSGGIPTKPHGNPA